MKINKRSLVINALWLLVFTAVVFSVRAYRQHDLARGAAPVLADVTLDGRSLSLEKIDKPVLVYFWASWCRICRWEQGAIQSIATTRPVISIAMQSGSDAQVSAYVTRHDLRFPVINDEDGSLSRRFGVKVVPTTFIVDGQGNITFTEVGYTTGPGLHIRLWLAGLMD